LNRSILNAFLADQRKAKSIVSAKLNVAQDMPGREWGSRYTEIRDAYNANPFAEIFSPHGYGLELKVGDLYIDYDYSETGRPDGFDAWRIFVYVTAGQYDNNGPDKYLCDRIFQWFDEITQSGYIVQLDNLHYIKS
jgi:hypothetical protein